MKRTLLFAAVALALSACSAVPPGDQIAFDKQACAADVVNAKHNYRAAFKAGVRDVALEQALEQDCLAYKGYILRPDGGDAPE